MTTPSQGTATSLPTGSVERLYRPPLVGFIALVVVLLAMPLTHSLSMLARSLSESVGLWLAYVPMGVAGLLLLIWGIRRNTEVAGTLIGFACGLLLWTGWAAFSFRINEVSLDLPMPALNDATQWPVNLLFIQASLGICIVSMLYFILSRDTRCNAFLWLQRRFRLDFGRPDSAQGRNYCRITFIETVYVTWFCYGAALLLADPRVVGYGTLLHYVLIGLLTVWGFYLLWRLFKFTRIMAAIRYAIPTKAILWITFGEALPNYGWYDEVWLAPLDHPGAMLGALAVFAALFVITIFLPQRRKV